MKVTPTPNPVNNIVKDWERAKAYTKEYLDAMPESGYALKPTPEMRSFAEQMLHLTDASYGFASAATGEKSPVGQGESEKTADKSKANVTKLVMAGYDFVINNVQKMTPVQLNESVKLFGQFDITKGTALAKCFEHQIHPKLSPLYFRAFVGKQFHLVALNDTGRTFVKQISVLRVLKFHFDHENLPIGGIAVVSLSAYRANPRFYSCTAPHSQGRPFTGAIKNS